MTNRILKILIHIVPAVLFSLSLQAQQPLDKNWSAEKIKGTRFFPYVRYEGFPFLNDRWVIGKMVFADGEVSDTLRLMYSSYRDDVIYFNRNNSTRIVIDKASLDGFSFNEKDGRVRVFRKLYSDNHWKGFHYFEVLVEGDTELLCFRKVDLISTSVYKDKDGFLKNMVYSPVYSYYIYSPGKGYLPVKKNIFSLLSKFDKTQQKPIKKMLRKKRISIVDEDTFVQAWKAIVQEGYQIKF
ncbi:MAG: hypothetical protein WC384_06170 [Prolixibacteraceae bacterium]